MLEYRFDWFVRRKSLTDKNLNIVLTWPVINKTKLVVE